MPSSLLILGEYVKCQIKMRLVDPVLILKEGATQTKGKDAQKNNITVG